MKIFVLTVQQTWSGEVHLTLNAAFTTREKAEKVFNEHLKIIKDWLTERKRLEAIGKLPNNLWLEDETEPLFYELWVSGDYTNNFYAISVKEIELNDEQLI